MNKRKKYHKSKVIISALVIGATLAMLKISLASIKNSESSVHNKISTSNVQGDSEYKIIKEESADKKRKTEDIKIDINLNEHYITNTGNNQNLYYIDEKNILWGCGDNEHGQLGQGTKDWEFHEDMLKIAENVVHVDYSGEGFMIYLTEDQELYGLGNGGTGALQQFFTYSGGQYGHNRPYDVTEPVLLLSDVAYARCGRDDIAAIKKDSTVWIWGVLWQQGEGNFNYIDAPKKVLEGAELITGGFFNHAALLDDGSVWTWGYNLTGNCGVAEPRVISEPQKAADQVAMVWTDSMKKNVDCFDIRELDVINKESMQNTIIQKKDGTYWICGIHIGNEEKTISPYFEMFEYTVICTHKFHPYNIR